MFDLMVKLFKAQETVTAIEKEYAEWHKCQMTTHMILKEEWNADQDPWLSTLKETYTNLQAQYGNKINFTGLHQ